MEFNTFDCTLRFHNAINETKIHSVPLNGVSKQEIQFLSFLHGHDAIIDIVFAGKKPLVMERGKDGAQDIYCQSERDDLKRIARRYDKIVDPGVGKANVERCFQVRLDGFENVAEEVNAVEVAARAVEAAEAEAAAREGAQRRDELQPQKPAPELPPVGDNIGAKLFSGATAARPM